LLFKNKHIFPISSIFPEYPIEPQTIILSKLLL
jgi:hypothetical protein